MVKRLLFVLFLCSNVTYGQKSPVIYLDGIVSTNLNERDFALSPDGNVMMYTVQANQHALSTIIFSEKLSENKWSSPEIAPFSGVFSDLEPAFAPDGSRLFFSSNRPVQGSEPKDYDIWYVEKTIDGWSAPRTVGAPVNSPKNEFYPSITRSGNLYFTAEYENGIGKEDIFMSRWTNGHFTKPETLDTAVNSRFWEFNAFVDPEETFIVFTSYGRTDDQGGGDLYIAFRVDGKWQASTNVNVANSGWLDYCPFVSNGKFYFTSGRHNIKTGSSPSTFKALKNLYNGTTNGSENIYVMDWSEIVSLYRQTGPAK